MSEKSIVVTKIMNVPRAVIRYFKESYTELKKVSWPTRETTIQYTIIVAAASIFVGIVIGGIDFLLTLAFEQLII